MLMIITRAQLVDFLPMVIMLKHPYLLRYYRNLLPYCLRVGV
jgi:hypothetical protein